MKRTIESAVSSFGAAAKSKLSNLAASGQPEDQLRAPLEQFLSDLGRLCNLPQGSVVAVGESSVSDLKTRPDYAVTVRNILAGFIELKAPGKGADPRKFKDPHDKAPSSSRRSKTECRQDAITGFASAPEILERQAALVAGWKSSLPHFRV